MLEADLWRSEAQIGAFTSPERAASLKHGRNAARGIVAEEIDEIPENKDEGIRRWQKEMELIFLRGADPDFDYKEVDGNEEYDDRIVQEREAEESWFEQEEPSWVEDTDQDTGKAESLRGETGVQDY